jgi:hypothetical protein
LDIVVPVVEPLGAGFRIVLISYLLPCALRVAISSTRYGPVGHIGHGKEPRCIACYCDRLPIR